jgi:haloacetate dehalogenase
MLDGFATTEIDTGEATILVRHAGSGPPLLLLHGYPQTHLMWHRVAPRLAEEFTVVAPDLRATAPVRSPRPPPTTRPTRSGRWRWTRSPSWRPSASPASPIAGHDRGGRIATGWRSTTRSASAAGRARHRPDRGGPAAGDAAFALGYWHWFFLAAPARCPRR